LGDASKTETLTVEQELDQLRSKLDEANGLYLRSRAELENFRKRSRREMDGERRYAGLSVMRDLLSVLDNLQRAIEAAEKSEGASGLLEGVKMVADQLLGVLEQHNCKQIEAIGAAFDPNLHEAIGQLPSDEHPVNTVTQETRIGYQLHDRVIRPSQVFVSTGAAENASKDESASVE
jgi:molecular chaperone GrpE